MAETGVERALSRTGWPERRHAAVVEFLRDLIRVPTHSPARLGHLRPECDLVTAAAVVGRVVERTLPS
jgi:hypothetical protein